MERSPAEDLSAGSDTLNSRSDLLAQFLMAKSLLIDAIHSNLILDNCSYRTYKAGSIIWFSHIQLKVRMGNLEKKVHFQTPYTLQSQFCSYHQSHL